MSHRSSIQETGTGPEVLAATPPPVARVLDRIRGTARMTAAVGGGLELTFQAMGTRCRVVLNAPDSPARMAAADLVAWVARFEATYSRFLPDSLIGQINAAAGRHAIALDTEADGLLALGEQLWFLTRGLLDPTVLPLVRIWDWRMGRVPGPEEIEAARRVVGWRRVRRGPGWVFLPEAGMSLDLGGIGKEYAVDQAVALAARPGVAGVLVDFGADVRVLGDPPDGRPAWVIGLEDPLAPGETWCRVALRQGAVATSGDYLRRFQSEGRGYGHILDPRSGRPVDNPCRAVHVVAPSCTQAGMLSTAAFVLGGEEGRRLIDSTPGAEGALWMPQQRLTTLRFHEHVLP